MTGRDVLKVICMTVCIVSSGSSWAQDDATVSARKIADGYMNSTSNRSLKGFDHADPAKYGHVIGFHYFEEKDLGDGWKGDAEARLSSLTQIRCLWWE
ncbi:hypothetical protein [Bradyrhizobium sp. STM 3557]|uniref:hypothetical protein n=1 Tax=Bradyrhizobium sp. STM 3557 TaxID=578920 RepID=UPI00388CFC19